MCPCVYEYVCPTHILTMHNRISKNVGTKVHHDVSCTKFRPVHQMLRSLVEGKGQNDYCLIGLTSLAHIFTMQHRISKLLGTHDEHDEVACGAIRTIFCHMVSTCLILKCVL